MKTEDWLAIVGAVLILILIGFFGSGSPVRLTSTDADVAAKIANTTMPSGPSGTSTLIAAPAGQGHGKTATTSKDGTSASTESGNLTLALAKLQNSLVNIACDVHTASGTFLASGSGTIIDSRGIILTNSHVAQFALLTDGPITTTCTIRTGSPATAAYYVKPIYVSPSWIQTYPGTALSGSPRGTGENDFALLAITASATSFPLPSSFPALSLTRNIPRINDRVAIGSYGAQGLDFGQVKYLLTPTLVTGSIKDIFAFSRTTDLTKIDLIALGANDAAQSGSSGGGVVNEKGELIGVITTSRPGTNVSALTIGHVRRSFESDTKEDFDSYLARYNVTELVENFKDESKKLQSTLQPKQGIVAR